MTYRIVSDVSGDPDHQEISFCIKIINGITLTYCGRFKGEVGHNTVEHEIKATYMGLSMVSDSVKAGDTVCMYSDVVSTMKVQISKGRVPYFSSMLSELKQKGVNVHIHGIGKGIEEPYNQCHNRSRNSLRVRNGRYGKADLYMKHKDSKIWNIENSLNISSEIHTTY